MPSGFWILMFEADPLCQAPLIPWDFYEVFCWRAHRMTELVVTEPVESSQDWRFVRFNLEPFGCSDTNSFFSGLSGEHHVFFQ